MSAFENELSEIVYELNASTSIANDTEMLRWKLETSFATGRIT
jgi:hypothetical protein